MFQCDKCPKSYNVPTSLRRHQRDVHENPRIQCDKCPTTFGSEDSFRLHKQKFHPPLFLQRGTQTYMSCMKHGFRCTECHNVNFTYQQYRETVNHQQIHFDSESNIRIAQPYYVP